MRTLFGRDHYLMKDQNPLDKRYFPRWKVANRVLYKLDGEDKFREGKTSDLSCAGVCVEIRERFFPKQKVKLTIYLEDEVPVSLVGNVVWHKNYGLKSQIGIDFDEIGESVQSKILKYAFEIKKDDVRKHWFDGWNNPK